MSRLEGKNFLGGCSCGGGGCGGRCRLEDVVDLSGDAALEAADDLGFGASLGGATLDVGAGGRVEAHADEDEAVEGGVGVAVAASVDLVTDVLSRGCLDGGNFDEIVASFGAPRGWRLDR
jgi:hypothetical protein